MRCAQVGRGTQYTGSESKETDDPTHMIQTGSELPGREILMKRVEGVASLCGVGALASTAPHDNGTSSSEPCCFSMSLDYRKTTVKQPHAGSVDTVAFPFCRLYSSNRKNIQTPQCTVRASHTPVPAGGADDARNYVLINRHTTSRGFGRGLGYLQSGAKLRTQ